ncbi:MAG: hypothetical protein AAF245_03345 [Pseudomonadota bacterium]
MVELMDRVACRTPAAGRDGSTAIPAWKFDTIRTAILAELTEAEVFFKDLAARVEQRLSAEDLSKLGSLKWHVTTVKLELEVRGEVQRVVGPGLQRLRLGRNVA